MLDKIKFPYLNMQQMNLDWVMARVAHTPEVVEAPPLSEDNNQSVYTTIDSMANNAPDGLSFIICGSDDDADEKRCGIVLWKMGFDNLYGIILSTSQNLRGRQCAKINGTWMMYA